MQVTLPDIRYATRSLAQAGELIWAVEDRASVLINATAVSSGTYKLYGSMNYGDPAATAQWIAIPTIDSASVEVAAGTAITPATSKTVYACCAGYTHIRAVEQNAGTASLQLSATVATLTDILAAAGATISVQSSHGKTIKTVTGTVSVDTDIVTAVTGKRIKVIAISLITQSTTTVLVTMQSNATGGLATYPLQATSGTIAGVAYAVDAPSFLFATAAGEKLTLDVSSANNVTYTVTYFDDDAT